MFSHRFTAIEHILKASEIMEISNILTRIQQIEHGFQHIFMEQMKSFLLIQKNNVLNLLLTYSNKKPIKSACWQQQYWDD